MKLLKELEQEENVFAQIFENEANEKLPFTVCLFDKDVNKVVGVVLCKNRDQAETVFSGLINQEVGVSTCV